MPRFGICVKQTFDKKKSRQKPEVCELFCAVKITNTDTPYLEMLACQNLLSISFQTSKMKAL